MSTPIISAEQDKEMAALAESHELLRAALNAALAVQPITGGTK